MLMEISTSLLRTKTLKFFLITFDLKCRIKKPICFQSSHPNCIEIILTNKKEILKNSYVLAAGISDHQSFIVTAFKGQLIKENANIKFYWKYSSFQGSAGS